MREELYKLTSGEIKEMYLHDTKALITALEAGADWVDLKHIRERIRDMALVIDEKISSDKVVWS
jgi:hypothetical protein